MLTNTDREQIIAQYQRGENDTGSPEVQVAVLTERIESLKNHLLIHKNDNHSRRGILLMVAKRRKLLMYVKRKDVTRYETLIQRLDLRK